MWGALVSLQDGTVSLPCRLSTDSNQRVSTDSQRGRQHQRSKTAGMVDLADLRGESGQEAFATLAAQRRAINPPSNLSDQVHDEASHPLHDYQRHPICTTGVGTKRACTACRETTAGLRLAVTGCVRDDFEGFLFLW